jgi:hypothetical protein
MCLLKNNNLLFVESSDIILDGIPAVQCTAVSPRGGGEFNEKV